MKATIQVLPGGNLAGAKEILKNEEPRIKSIYQLSEAELEKMLRPWMQGSRDLSAYLPTQIDLTFHNARDISIVSDRISKLKDVKFISHSDAIRDLMVFGGAVGGLAFVIILFVSLAAGMAIVFSTNSMIKIHNREINILAVVGAFDSFIMNHISTVILKLTAIGSAAGLAFASIAVYWILDIAQSQKTGIIAQMSLTSFDLLILGLIPVLLSAGSFLVSRFVILRALKGNSFK